MASIRGLLANWAPLLKAGYIPLGDFDAGWGPFCADTMQPIAGDKSEKVAPIARPLWPGFEQLMRELELGAVR